MSEKIDWKEIDRLAGLITEEVKTTVNLMIQNKPDIDRKVLISRLICKIAECG